MDLKENIMLKGAMKLARDCTNITSDDTVAVVCDYESFEVGNQMARACLMLGACTNMIVMEPTERHGAPVPEMVGAAMEKATAAFLVTTKSMVAHERGQEGACQRLPDRDDARGVSAHTDARRDRSRFSGLCGRCGKGQGSADQSKDCADREPRDRNGHFLHP